MPLVDAAYVRQKGNLPSSSVLADDRISAFFADATRRLKRWVGTEAYADAALVTPVDPDRAAALKDAEAFLVIAEGLPSWNRAAVGAGIVKEKGIGVRRDQGQIVLLTPEEINAEVKRAVEQAERSAYPYITAADLSFDPIEVDDE